MIEWLLDAAHDPAQARLADGICTTLGHSVWLGLAAALLYWVITKLGALPTARARYRLGGLLLAALPLALLAIFAGSYEQSAALVVEGNLAAPALLPIASEHVPAATAAAPAAAGVWPWWGNLLVASCWLSGFVVLSARCLGSWALLRLWVERSTSPMSEQWQRRAARLVSRIGLSASVRFVVSAVGDVPFTLGWLRPVVVLPAAVLAGLAPAQIELLLLHELAHLRRADFVINMLQSLIEALLFFHPAVWWLSTQIRREREQACDELVLSGHAKRLDYAKALTQLEICRSTAPHPALGSNSGHLKQRIAAILAVADQRQGSKAWLLVVLAAAAMMTAVAAVACSADGDAPQDQTVRTQPAQLSTAPAELSIAWLPPAVRRWSAQILEASEQQQVDPRLIALMVLVESGGDTSAKSSSGARGLMQLMPATARAVAKRSNQQAPSKAELHQPARNLQLGTRLIAELLERFRSRETTRQIELALAAYNAGSARVRRHLKAAQPLPAETRRYTKLLMALWAERDAGESAAFRAWRARALKRARTAHTSPLPGGKLTSAFGPRRHPIRGQADEHRGLDISHRSGTAVLAPLAGRVVVARSDNDARGLYIVIRHSVGLQTQFHHMASLNVKAGDRVAAGDVIGAVGDSGETTGPHLHFELHDLGQPIDPLPLLSN